MLTWGVAAPQTMVEADAAPSPWWHDENQNNFCARPRRIYGQIGTEGVTRKNRVKLVLVFLVVVSGLHSQRTISYV